MNVARQGAPGAADAAGADSVDAEEVDGLPVLSRAVGVAVPGAGASRRGLALPGAPSSALMTGTGFLAGVLTLALLRRRRDGGRTLVRRGGRGGGRGVGGRRGGAAVRGRGRRPAARGPARLVRIVDSRSILLDIHLVDRD